MSDICASTLIWSGWLKPGELAFMPREEWRQALISAMERQGVGDHRGLRSQLNEQLALTAEIYMHLRENGRDPRGLAATTPAARRELLLAELHERRGTPIESMRDCDDRRLLTIASASRLRERLALLIPGLEEIGAGEPVVYRLTDDDGRGMDALKVLPQGDNQYLGVYHTWVEDAFHLRVAASSDLVSWERIAELGSRNHHGEIRAMGEGYIIANERDDRDGSHLRFRYYDSLEKLTANEPCYDRNIPRTLSRSHEGAPDLRYIETGEPGESVILAGFRYTRRYGLVRRVERLAQGVLRGFDRWTPWIDETANRAIGALGYKGGFGGRHAFHRDGGRWYIQAAQERWRDWSSWRVLLGNGRSYVLLEPRTAGGSRSLTDPCLAAQGGGRHVASFHLPRQGSVPGEEGELLFGFQAGG